MTIKEKTIRRNSEIGSGRIKQYIFPKGKKLTQITTFCPDIIGPGPTHIYLIEDGPLTLIDTGIPTHLAKKLFYYWRRQQIPPEVEALPDDYSETELRTGLRAVGYSLEDIEHIVITHGHPDHYLVGKTVVQGSKALVSAHVLDTDRICNPWSISKGVFEGRPRYSAMGMPTPKYSAQEYHEGADMDSSNLSLKVDFPISRDGPLPFVGTQSDFITVKHFPGHSPGSISIYWIEKKALFTGDLIFKNGIGRTDLPGGNGNELKESIKRLKTLDVEYLLSGHGDVIFGKQAVEQNFEIIERQWFGYL